MLLYTRLSGTYGTKHCLWLNVFEVHAPLLPKQSNYTAKFAITNLISGNLNQALSPTLNSVNSGWIDLYTKKINDIEITKTNNWKQRI